MIRHIVMMKFSDRENWKSIAIETARQLNALPNCIEELLRLETGINMNTRPTAYDLVLTADFNNEMALDAYRVHQAHVEVLDYLKPRVEKITVVDYEMK